MPHISEIQLRDPYVFTDHSAGVYYLCGSTDTDIWKGEGTGFDVYRGRDLEHWEGPFPAFRPERDFWSPGEYWAPELHAYRGRHYLFATFGPGRHVERRGTAVLAADTPLGPFVPHSADDAGRPAPVTPRQWECLDGTLHVDDAGAPWMVFCHEWVQIADGAICAVRLSEDLSRAEGEPVRLFSASEAPWVEPLVTQKRGTGWITDGPFLRRSSEGALLMLWASFRGGRYAQGLAVSESGSVTGPWRHEPDPLYEADGGHGMLFETLRDAQGRSELMLTLHTPNRTPQERAVFIPVQEHGGTLRVRA